MPAPKIMPAPAKLARQPLVQTPSASPVLALPTVPVLQQKTSDNKQLAPQKPGTGNLVHENDEQCLPSAPVFPVQKKENKAGLPDHLKAGIEHLSGFAMDDVKVHYNSAKPVALQAHACAQGTDIQVAAGQEKHLPPQAWHVAQQKQGRVKATKGLSVAVNDDSGLEHEANVMGAKATLRRS